MRFQFVCSVQLFELDDHHAAQDLSLLLPHQLAGCIQCSCNTQVYSNTFYMFLRNRNGLFLHRIDVWPVTSVFYRLNFHLII